MMWLGDSFPISRESRDAAWQEIAHAEFACPECVPNSPISAWDIGKRSREYMNGRMGKFDLDNLYYSQAYRKDEISG